MRILFFDTSTDLILTEIFELKKNELERIYSFKGYFPRESSFRLVKDIENALEKTNTQIPDLIISCRGPGSFTGIRICVATARNFAQIWNKPVLGLDTLETYSSYYYQKYKKPVLLILDGKQKKFFTGYYDENGYRGPFDLTEEEIKNRFEKELSSDLLVAGDIDRFDRKISIYDDIPDGFSIIRNKIQVILDANKENNGYDSLLPEYMRESYARTPDTNTVSAIRGRETDTNNQN